MKPSSFLIYFLLAVTISLVIIFIASLFPEAALHLKFYGFSVGFLAILSIIYYFAGSNSRQSRNIYLFTWISLLMTLIKLIGCSLFIYYYKVNYLPTNSIYIYMFFLFYLIFTLLEIFTLRQNDETN
jgi:hypothetical protein